MANGRNKFNNKPSDPRGAHVRLYWEVLDSNAWRCLNSSDKLAYLALHRQLRSNNNGDLSLPMSVAIHHGIKSDTTLAKALRSLCAVGLIALTRKGGCTREGHRLPSLYRLTDFQAHENQLKNIAGAKPTNEWKEVKSIAMGRAVIRSATLAGKKTSEKTKTAPQKLKATTSIIGVVETLTTPIPGVRTHLPTPINGAGEKGKTPRKLNGGAGSGKLRKLPTSDSHTPKSGVLSTVAIPMADLVRASAGNPARDARPTEPDLTLRRPCMGHKRQRGRFACGHGGLFTGLLVNRSLVMES